MLDSAWHLAHGDCGMRQMRLLFEEHMSGKLVRLVLGALALAYVVVMLSSDYAFKNLAWNCPFHALTGMKCGGCGGQQAAFWLFHGRFVEAIKCNLFLTTAMPILVVFLCFDRLRRIVVSISIVLALLWCVGRNLAGL